jgi:type VI secretion system protein ImpK
MPDIDDPFKPSDATVLRPRPGAGKRGSSTDSGPLPFRPPSPAAASPAYVEPISATAREFLGAGLNPLVQAASPLLLLAGQLRGTLSSPDLPGLRRYTLDEIRRFEERARSSGVPNENVLAARYALCAALDESVLSTPWGAQSEWAQQPLLVALHREAWGGEKFFEMLDRISQDPSRFIDLMELQYLCIAFGFAGKYQVLDRGHARLAEVHHDLYRRIRAHRGQVPQELALKWRGVEDRRNRLIRYVPWWVVGAAALAILAVTFAIYYARLGDASEPVIVQLAQVGSEQFDAPQPAAPVAGPTLKQLLAEDERAGRLTVAERDGRTVVTLVAADLFASGSATPNQAYQPMLTRIAGALNQVPGHVLIEGHTDDQALRSLRFRNNAELSRERAVSVARILERTIDNRARLEWRGLGSSRPLYSEPTPENRARNRRVEIIHVRG